MYARTRPATLPAPMPTTRPTGAGSASTLDLGPAGFAAGSPATQPQGTLERLAAAGAPPVGSAGVDAVRAGAVLGTGARGTAVVDLQQKLNRLGYGVQPTGVMGPTTTDLLRSFQGNNRIAPTGKLGPTTLAGLEQALPASITLEELRQFAPGVDEKTARTWLPHLNASMGYADIRNDKRKAAYLAQIAHESDGFRTFEEYASGADYEGRSDLGNTRRGDGVRFKGRGAIQLTGRANYREIGRRLGVDFEKNPELLERPEYAFLASADYWKRHDLNELADAGDFEGITDVINYHDPESRRRSRRAYHVRARDVLAENRHRHVNAPGTIGGPAKAPGDPTSAAQPWWTEDPEPVRQDRQERYGAWFDDILEGNALDTRDAVAADAARHREGLGMAKDGQDDETRDAGLMWQIGDAFAATWKATGSEDWSSVMDRSHQAAERTRELRDKGLVPADRAQVLLDELGRRYTDAKARANEGGLPSTNRASGDARDRAPLYDQHRMNHERGWAFCGLATLATTLESNGLDSGVDFGNRSSIERNKQGIYVQGAGTSGAGMAGRMRKAGLEDARFSMGGTVEGLMPSLAAGKALPVGFVSMGGEVVDLPRSSARYGHLKEGSRHGHTFGEAGHWATVVGFEGPEHDPTHFLVNDSDSGARIRMTRAEFEKHTAARSGIWNVNY